MPSIESIKKYIEVIGVEEKEELLHYLWEIFVLGSFTAEVTN